MIWFSIGICLALNFEKIVLDDLEWGLESLPTQVEYSFDINNLYKGDTTVMIGLYRRVASASRMYPWWLMEILQEIRGTGLVIPKTNQAEDLET